MTKKCVHKPSGRSVGDKDKYGTIPTEIYCDKCEKILVPYRRL